MLQGKYCYATTDFDAPDVKPETRMNSAFSSIPYAAHREFLNYSRLHRVCFQSCSTPLVSNGIVMMNFLDMQVWRRIQH